MPEPENGAAEDLNPETPNTTPDEPTVDVAPDNTAEVAAAKVTELQLALAAKDTVIAGLEAEIQKWKAANYDLLMSAPAEDPADDPADDLTPDSDIDEEFPSIEDILYEKE